MERQDKDKIDINERIAKFGKTMGVWVCSGCKHEVSSFLYNWEYHIPEHCPQCGDYEMVEDKTRREIGSRFNIIDRSREKNWEQGLSPAQQASVLLGEMDPY